MRKTIFKIGVILLFAFFVVALVRDDPSMYMAADLPNN